MRRNFVLVACESTESGRDVPVWQLQVLPRTIMVEVDLPNRDDCALVSLSEIGINGRPLDVSDDLTRNIETSGPVYIIQTDLLNIRSGYHLYQMQFIDKITDEPIYRYFAYSMTGIQNDNYKYMDRR